MGLLGLRPESRVAYVEADTRVGESAHRACDLVEKTACVYPGQDGRGEIDILVP